MTKWEVEIVMIVKIFDSWYHLPEMKKKSYNVLKYSFSKTCDIEFIE